MWSHELACASSVCVSICLCALTGNEMISWVSAAFCGDHEEKDWKNSLHNHAECLGGRPKKTASH